MRKFKIAALILILLSGCLFSAQIEKQKFKKLYISLFAPCPNAKSLKYVLDLVGFIWVTAQKVDIGNGYSVWGSLEPDSHGNFSLQSKPCLTVQGPGLPANGKKVTFTWVEWSSPVFNKPEYEGYTHLKTAHGETVVAIDKLKKYKIEFTKGYHLAQPTSDTPGRDWISYFCYKGPTLQRQQMVIKK